MKADLYLKNGLIVTEEQCFEGGVVVKEGKIAQLISSKAAIEAEEVVDLQGKVVLPGLVDDHVHFNEPGRTHWEGKVRSMHSPSCRNGKTVGVRTRRLGRNHSFRSLTLHLGRERTLYGRYLEGLGGISHAIIR